MLVVNGRELSRPNLTSLGFIICSLLPEVAKYTEIVVCTPRGRLSVDAAGLFDHVNIQRVELRSECAGWWGRIYFYILLYLYIWRTRPIWFWEVNHAVGPTPRRTAAIVTVHDFYPLHPRLNKSLVKALIFRFKIWLTWRMASLIIYPTVTTKREAHGFFHKPFCAETVLPNGVPRIEGYAPRSFGSPPLRIGYLGRINYWKGVDRLLEHAMQCDAVEQLTLAGTVDRIFFDSIAGARSDLLDKVVLLGPILEAEKAQFFESVSVFVYETRYDGFGIPPLEAMLYCLPTIVSDIPVMREVLRDHALYIDQTSSDPLGEAIGRLYAMTPSQYQNFVGGARDYALAHDWRNAGAKFIVELSRLENVGVRAQ